MIRASELSGRTVVDIDVAEKLGSIERLILDPEGRRVAGFVVSRGGFTGSKDHRLVPAAAIHSIGPDAVTVKHDAVTTDDNSRLETLPRGSDVIGRKVLTEDGRYLGKVEDVLIDREDGRIFGYVLGDHKGKGKHPYLPADANLRAGKDLIVASESAMRYDWSHEEAPAARGHWSDPFTTGENNSAWMREPGSE